MPVLASRLLAKQQFNIHSTSIAAWTSLLHGLSYQDWPSIYYPNAKGIEQPSIMQHTGKHAFTRFSQSVAETFQAPETPAPTDASLIANSEFYRRGLRHFEANQLRQLATNIVSLLKQRAIPFTSMEAFLSPQSQEGFSLLEKAIAMTFAPQGNQYWDQSWEINRLRSLHENQLKIDHFAPGHISQADLLAGIGSHLSTRSDTFSIRAFATTFQTEHTPRVVGLEARLQRIPTPCQLEPALADALLSAACAG